MSLETCPFCGKAFKRLRSHLPHCKMSPGLKTVQMTDNTLKETPDPTFKHTGDKDKTCKLNTETRLSYQKIQVKSKSPKFEKVSADNEFLQNSSQVTITSTSSKVPSTETAITNTLKHKSKWLAKREQEKLRKVKLQTQTRIKITGVSQHNSKIYENPVNETPLLEKEVNGQKKVTRTSLTSYLTTNSIDRPVSELLQSGPWTTPCQPEQDVPQCQASPDASEQIQTSPKTWTNEYSSGYGIKSKNWVVFQTKTCVWDHIKQGLYKKRHDHFQVSFPVDLEHKVPLSKCVNTFEFVIKPYTGNDQNATTKTSPVPLPIFQTSGQKQVEDRLSSRLQNVPVMGYSPDMATGYGGTFFVSSHSEISTNGNFLEYQTPKPSTQSQAPVTQLRLGDVRLNELASWYGAHSPKSPKEALTIVNKGWQWYYRKYIDVQKGGFGGIAMLIGSYCVLSYIWNYPNIKKHRWRKYH
ncbi:uncharacterized protein si:dkey-21c1.4 isoform X1 [Clarias gariepinus]|uniref:uncharacterized protein si:dkey-21c1.4 isoform X1 n=1 Tax=Clarias gariepinus TaxID=13013 RepID=UPI00234CDE15|nr:uncharacterized protein si:dkey-21c1.4 isoform X1 [Clarias gariepinus]